MAKCLYFTELITILFALQFGKTMKSFRRKRTFEGDDAPIEATDDSLSNEETISPLPMPAYIEADLIIALAGQHFTPITIDRKTLKPRKPLDPPPPQFSEVLHTEFSTNPFLPNFPEPFDPIALYTKTDEAWRGLTPLYPVVLEARQVPEAAWVRFLEDVLLVCQLPWNLKKASSYLPLLVSGGYQMHRYLMKSDGRARFKQVKDLVDVWNKKYFSARHVEILFQGPDDIREIRQRQEESFSYKKRSGWDMFKKDYTQLRPEDRARIVIMSI